MKEKFLEKLVFLLFALFSIWLMWHTFGLENGRLKLSSKVYSDFGAHIPLIRSFSLGQNFPPEYPQFAGEPIHYHYLFYLAVAGLERLGLNLVWSMNILSSAGFFLLLLMIYSFTKILFRSKKAALLAVILFLFNGSLSFIEFFKKFPNPAIWMQKLLTLHDFVSFGPWDGGNVSAFWNLNIFTNQRHLALSYSLVLLLLWPLLKIVVENFKQVGAKKIQVCQVTIIWLAFAFFPLLHQAGFAILIGFTLALFILFPKLLKTNWWIVYLWGVVFALLTFLFLPGNNLIGFKVGFLAQNKTLWSILKYWFFNLGLYLFFIPYLFIKLNFRNKKIWLIFLAVFVSANLWQFSADMINNHKFITFFLIGMNIFVAGTIYQIWRKSFYQKLLVMIIVVILTFSGVVDLFPIINDHFHYLDSNQSETVSFLLKNTQPDSTFLTTTYLYNPVLLAGRKTFLDYGYFAWSLGYPDSARRTKLSTLFAKNISLHSLCVELTKNGIDHILFSPGRGEISFPDPKSSMIYNHFEPNTVLDDGYQLFDVATICFN